MRTKKRSTVYKIGSQTKYTEMNFYDLRKELESLNYDSSSIFKTILILEELLTNILKYSKTQEDIALAITYSDKNLKINIVDSGKSFNPLEAKTPKLNKAINNIHPGGLGIHIVKNMVKSIDYFRVGGDNILTLAILVKKTTAVNNCSKNTVKNPILISRNLIPPLVFKTNIHQAVQI